MKFLRYKKFELILAKGLLKNIIEHDPEQFHNHGPSWRVPKYCEFVGIGRPSVDDLGRYDSETAIHEDTAAGILADVLKEAFAEIDKHDALVQDLLERSDPENDLRCVERLTRVRRALLAHVRSTRG